MIEKLKSPQSAGRVFTSAMLARNVTYLPIWMYVGEDDRGFEGAKTLRDTIAQYGPAPLFTSAPGLSHHGRGRLERHAGVRGAGGGHRTW